MEAHHHEVSVGEVSMYMRWRLSTESSVALFVVVECEADVFPPCEVAFRCPLVDPSWQYRFVVVGVVGRVGFVVGCVSGDLAVMDGHADVVYLVPGCCVAVWGGRDASWSYCGDAVLLILFVVCHGVARESGWCGGGGIEVNEPGHVVIGVAVLGQWWWFVGVVVVVVGLVGGWRVSEEVSGCGRVALAVVETG